MSIETIFEMTIEVPNLGWVLIFDRSFFLTLVFWIFLAGAMDRKAENRIKQYREETPEKPRETWRWPYICNEGSNPISTIKVKGNVANIFSI